LDWQLGPYVWTLAASAAVTALLGLYAGHRRMVPGAGPFSVAMIMGSLWSIANALEMSSPGLPGKLFWANLQYLSSASIPVLWLVAILRFTDRGRWLTHRRVLWLFVVPAVTVILVWTNDFHGLMRRDIYLDTGGQFPVVGKTYGPWFWVHGAYSYVLTLLSLPPLVGMIRRAPTAFVGQPLTLLVGFIFPAVGNVAFVLGFSPVHRFDITPVLLGAGGLVVAWALFRHRLFDVAPLARDQVFDAISDAVIVLDDRGNIVDLNRAARAFLGEPATAGTRKWPAQTLANRPELVELCSRPSPARTELVVGKDGAQRYYEAQTSQLKDRSGRLSSQIISIHDITERKWAQAQWLQQQRTLASLEARERLEREVVEALHSRVQSKLSVAWHNLGDCQNLLNTRPDEANAILGDARRLIDEIRDRDIEQVSRRLHPTILSLGLVPAIRALAEGFDEHLKVSVRIDPQIMQLDNLVENRIPEFMRLAVYRVLEEALTNVHHHARANRVCISMGIDDQQRLTLLIEDDGSGFEISNVKRGLGLSGIAGRVEETGGILKITSAEGQGTAISAIFPCFDQWSAE